MVSRLEKSQHDIVRVEHFIEVYIPITVQRIMRPSFEACLPQGMFHRYDIFETEILFKLTEEVLLSEPNPGLHKLTKRTMNDIATTMRL
jgi:hypothetical protein